MVLHIQARFPSQFEDLGEDKVRRRIQDGIERAERYEIRTQADVARFIRFMFGIRPDFDGLIVDPCVPGWKQFRIQRIFRGVTYDIRVSNPGRVERGVREIKLNGKPIDGNVVPVVKGRKRPRVDVVMG